VAEEEIRFRIRVKDHDVEHVIPKSLEGWALVNEVSGAAWLGKVGEYDKATRTMTLECALVVPSPPRTPVMVMTPNGPRGGAQSAFDCGFVMDVDSLHPVRDVYVSSVQFMEEVSDGLREWCFDILARAMLGPVDKVTGKRRRNKA